MEGVPYLDLSSEVVPCGASPDHPVLQTQQCSLPNSCTAGHYLGYVFVYFIFCLPPHQNISCPECYPRVCNGTWQNLLSEGEGIRHGTSSRAPGLGSRVLQQGSAAWMEAGLRESTGAVGRWAPALKHSSTWPGRRRKLRAGGGTPCSGHSPRQRPDSAPPRPGQACCLSSRGHSGCRNNM